MRILPHEKKSHFLKVLPDFNDKFGENHKRYENIILTIEESTYLFAIYMKCICRWKSRHRKK